MSEIWRDTVEGYHVSNHGRVFSRKSDRCLLPGLASNGYLTVSLHCHTYTVHSLVAQAFLGPRKKGHDVCHIDGNRLNNNAVNLRYDTRAGNFKDQLAHGTRLQGSKKPRSKLTEDQAIEIWQLRGTLSQSILAGQFRVSPACVQAIHDRRTWRHATHDL